MASCLPFRRRFSRPISLTPDTLFIILGYAEAVFNTPEALSPRFGRCDLKQMCT